MRSASYSVCYLLVSFTSLPDLQQDVMDQQVDGVTPDVSDKPASGQDGVWETTRLDSLIGDLQRGTAAGADATENQEVTEETSKSEGTATRRGSRKKRRPKPPRVIPTIRIYIGTFVHSTVDNPLVILDHWMIGVDGGKVCSNSRISVLLIINYN